MGLSAIDEWYSIAVDDPTNYLRIFSQGWQGSILQALLLVLGMFIYYPFIRVMDDQYLREERKAQEEESEEIDFDSFDFDDL